MPSFKLRPLSKNKFPKYIIFFDTETDFQNEWTEIEKTTESYRTVLGREHTLKLGWAFYYAWSKRRQEYVKRDEILFTQKREFTRWLISKAKKNKTLYIFAHNMGFDFRIGIDFNELKRRGFKTTAFITDAKLFIVRMRDEEKRRLVFLDSMNYYGRIPLFMLGDLYGLPKLHIDFEKASFEELSTYCYRDVEILAVSVIELLKQFKEDFGYTSPAIAFNHYRNNFMDYPIYIHDDRRVIQLEAESYRGGRTEVWKRGKFYNLYKVDVNSLYPYVMRNNVYPTKLIYWTKQPRLAEQKLFELLYNNDKVFIARVDVEVRKRVVGIKYNDRLVFPIGKLEKVVLTKPEIELILDEKGTIKKVYEIAVYEAKPIFKRYVDVYYEKKKNAKNKVEKTFTKLLLNSLYGKFGQQNEELERAPQWDGFHDNGYVDGDRGKLYFVNGEAFLVKGKSKANNSFIAIASFVTAYARCYMWKLIKTAKEKSVFYMDTDSLFVSKWGYRRLKKKGYIDSKELGKLKLEDILEWCEIRNVKDYSFKNTEGKEVHKIKGIPKHAKKIGENEYELTRISGFRESIRFFRMKVIEYKVRKKYHKDYKKGIERGSVILPFKFT